MIEIFLLIHLCKKIGERATEKGLTPGSYKLFVVLAWFGGEIVGGIFAAMMAELLMGPHGDPLLLVYLGAIGTASLSVWFVFKYVAIQPDRRRFEEFDDEEEEDLPFDRADSSRASENIRKADDRL